MVDLIFPGQRGKAGKDFGFQTRNRLLAGSYCFRVTTNLFPAAAAQVDTALTFGGMSRKRVCGIRAQRHDVIVVAGLGKGIQTRSNLDTSQLDDPLEQLLRNLVDLDFFFVQPDGRLPPTSPKNFRVRLFL